MSRLFSSRVCLVVAVIAGVAIGSMIAAERSSSAMADAATRLLNGLTSEQRQQATFAFDSDERTHWHFIPTETFPRKGLLIRSMNESQRRLAHDLLKAGLSQRGYLTATSIMDLETVLKALDPEKYFFSIFGTPSAKDTWGWRVEGHHVSLHFTVVNGTLVASSPSFSGTNPAEVREGPKKGLRILGG